MDGDEEHGPLPTPGTLPPSHPTPSQVGEVLPAKGDGAMLSLGGGGGGARLRLAVLAHQARMDAGAWGLDPTHHDSECLPEKNCAVLPDAMDEVLDELPLEPSERHKVLWQENNTALENRVIDVCVCEFVLYLIRNFFIIFLKLLFS